MKSRRIALPATLALVVAAAVVLVGAVTASAGTGAKAGKVGKVGKNDRLIYLTAVEWKGSAEVAKEPFPTTPLPEGGGYERFAPDATGKWNVETYRFDSAVVVACAGERVVLKIFGVNAAYHDISIPDFDKNFRVSRGHLTTTVFKVPKAGIYPIVCKTHEPSHRADLVVLSSCA